MELIIGSHVSFTKDKQLVGSTEEAIRYGGNTFMFYTGAPQNTTRAKIDEDRTKQAFELMKEHHIDPKNVIVHAPYIINLANTAKPESYQFAIQFLKQEVKRCEQLGMDKVVLHPGSYVSLDLETGLQNISAALNQVLTADTKVNILLEFMAGKGSECGTSFQDLKTIIDHVEHNDKLMVCFDTCHMNDAGLDLTDFDAILDEFDQIIGIEKLGCIHINDSKNEQGSNKDRHENFGFGTIGFDTLIHIVYNERTKHIPKILETPFVSENPDSNKRIYPPYKFEIEMIQTKTFHPHLFEEIRSFYQK